MWPISQTSFPSQFIHIQWKIHLAIILLLIVISQHNIAHTTCHVQNYVGLLWLKLDERRINIPSRLNCEGKILVKWTIDNDLLKNRRPATIKSDEALNDIRSQNLFVFFEKNQPVFKVIASLLQGGLGLIEFRDIFATITAKILMFGVLL